MFNISRSSLRYCRFRTTVDLMKFYHCLDFAPGLTPFRQLCRQRVLFAISRSVSQLRERGVSRPDQHILAHRIVIHNFEEDAFSTQIFLRHWEGPPRTSQGPHSRSVSILLHGCLLLPLAILGDHIGVVLSTEELYTRKI